MLQEPVVTWVTVEKPTFDLVGLVLGSFHLAGVLLAAAFTLGLLSGIMLIHSRRRLDPEPVDVALHLDDSRA